jgi:hypothetical protein
MRHWREGAGLDVFIGEHQRYSATPAENSLQAANHLGVEAAQYSTQMWRSESVL